MSSTLTSLSPNLPQTPSKASTFVSCVPTTKAVDLLSLNDLESGTIYPLSCPCCEEHLTVAVGSSCGCIGRVMKPPAPNPAEDAVLALASQGALKARRHRRRDRPRAPLAPLQPETLQERTAKVFRQNSEVLMDPMAPLSPLCPLPSPALVSASCPASLPVRAGEEPSDDLSSLSRTLNEVMVLYEAETPFPSSPASEYSSSPPPSPPPSAPSASSSLPTMGLLQARLDKVMLTQRRAKDVVEEFLGEVRGLEEEMLAGWRLEDEEGGKIGESKEEEEVDGRGSK